MSAVSNTKPAARIRRRNDAEAPQNARSVVYIMSRDQRLTNNHALHAAQVTAQDSRLSLHIVFCLRSSAKRSYEHYAFMIAGLREVAARANTHNISFYLVGESGLVPLLAQLQPAAVYIDFSPLKGSQQRISRLSRELSVPLFEVDAHNIVPAWVLSDHQEYAARTIRPKVHRMFPDFVAQAAQLQRHEYGTAKLEWDDAAVSDVLKSQKKNGQQLRWLPGEEAAAKALQDFIDTRLAGYATYRNDPARDHLSHLSPYLHFGMISAQQVIQAVLAASPHTPDSEALIEEMVVRKELSDNYCLYNHDYDQLAGAPKWALETLAKHQSDPREFVYSLPELEQAKTHDEAWNASQRQLMRTGKMHGYMRMYWAKKVLEWTTSPDDALRILVYLNDFYSIDGGDPNGYAGILWAIAGLHDRPWAERSVFGTVRYMNRAGLERKFDIDSFIAAYCEE